MSDGFFVRARKDHRCEFCARVIFNGSRYWFERITPWDHVNNEHFFTLRAHRRCIDASDDLYHDFDGIFPHDPGSWRSEVLVSRWHSRRSHPSAVSS